MASFLDKFKVTTAIDTNTTLDLSCTHVTTSDWLNMSPVYIKEMVPGESLKVHQETFSRMASMAVPTFGRGLIHNRAFFVPMRTIFKKWNEFITAADINTEVQGAGNGSSTAVSINTVPFITNKTLVELFISNGGASTNFATKQNNPSTSNPNYTFDIVANVWTAADTSSARYFNLTDQGRRLMKILQSLGYNIVWNAGPYSIQGIDDTKYSAMPLLGWLRIVLDWYYPSQYVGDADYLFVKSILDNAPTSGGVYEVKLADLQNIFGNKSIFNGLASYDSDYFVSAFDNPLGPTQGAITSSQVSIEDINYVYSNLTNQATKGTVGTFLSTVSGFPSQRDGGIAYRPALQLASTNGGTRITQFGLDALKALTDYVKRHQLVGARALDRLYARFGKSLDSAKLDRSSYIGAQNIPLQFGDVMSHAATQDDFLGSYAGKGIAYGADGNFEFSTDEYGYFVIISSIVPQIGYYQGVDRTNLHLGRTDFWTPEFDQIGNQAIAKMELISPMNPYAEINEDTQSGDPGNFATLDTVEGIFGYTPRYSEYKIGRDKLTGDFRYASKNGVGDTSSAWHLFRNVGAYADQGPAYLKHNRYFVTGDDWAQYNRVFNYTNSGVDKFYMIHTFNVTSNSPMHSLYDTYKFENEDEGAKKVVADVNGVKVN